MWTHFPHVVMSFDAVKPRAEWRGWNAERLARYNVARFFDLSLARWDLIIFDEAHKLAGASNDVARFQLASELARVAPNLLLLSATPHSGKGDAFRRLLSLIDAERFTGSAVPIERETVADIVVRTEKRGATDEAGKALFAPRKTRLLTVPFGAEHQAQELLYEEVSAYVLSHARRVAADGGREKPNGLLLVLVQRLVSSSTRTVRGGSKRDRPCWSRRRSPRCKKSSIWTTHRTTTSSILWPERCREAWQS